MRSLLRLRDSLNNLARRGTYFLVGKPKHPQALGLKKPLPGPVFLWRILMDGAVHLYDQACLGAIEVDYESSYRVLTSELESIFLAVPKSLPEQSLSSRRLMSRFTGNRLQPIPESRVCPPAFFSFGTV